jgi:hypothetical protein
VSRVVGHVVDVRIDPAGLPPVSLVVVESPPGSRLPPGTVVGSVPSKVLLDRDGVWRFEARFGGTSSTPSSWSRPTNPCSSSPSPRHPPQRPREPPGGRMASIVVIDYGSQYTRLITRRLRELQVFSVIETPEVTPARLRELDARGVVLSGGPQSVYAERAPQLPGGLLETGLPILAICYGMQLLARALGGDVAPSSVREYGKAVLTATTRAPCSPGSRASSSPG